MRILTLFLFLFVLALPINAADLVLSWTDNSTSETGFVIQRTAKLGADGKPDFTNSDIGSALANATEYPDTVAPVGVELWYQVYAVNGDLRSDPSAPAHWLPPKPSATPKPTATPAPKPPAKPTNLKVKSVP